MNRFLIFIFFIPLYSVSQVNNQDFGSWLKTSFEYKLNKKISFENKTELRTFDNSTQEKQIYTQFSSKLKFNKHISTLVALRLKFVNEEYGHEMQNRIHNDLNYKQNWKIGRWNTLTFYFRLRTQLNVVSNDLNELHERIRLKLKYRINNRLNSFIYDEWYLLMNNYQNNPIYTKNRLGVGFNYELNNYFSIQLKYLRITDVNVTYPQTMNVLGLGITHKLN